MIDSRYVVSVVGLGYVGLPVAIAMSRVFRTYGYDIKQERIQQLKEGFDSTGEIENHDLTQAKILFTDSLQDLKSANFHIIAVPTPIDLANRPNLQPVLNASRTVGSVLKKGDIVVYESTVYPGLTEEECLPILEEASGLRGGVDFKIGYSPERINPGDKEHTFSRIVKVVAGQDDESLEAIAFVYGSVVTAGIFKASSIKVAEAAKVIENTQRDLNIALMNELAIIFNRMGIDTGTVLEAAATKWNFLKFAPGLVGGHCIGVDPYYLTHKAEQLGYIPQVILAGRRINDEMGRFIASQTIKQMIQHGHSICGSTVTVLGLTFKENCSDLRNSKVVDVIHELKEFGVTVQVHDPLADPEEALREYGIEIMKFEELPPADAVIVAVAHNEFRMLSISELKKLTGKAPVISDVKGILDTKLLQANGIHTWRL